jgi:glucosamine 6-phosphate synthetase-like amidotransferase/phosphosugar isomerase protein
MGMRTIAIDTPDAPVPTAMKRFTLPALGESLSPFAASIPVQCLAYFLARALGGAPDESQDEADPARFYASQLLARRGELAGTLS